MKTPSVSHALRDELLPGELVLWTGAPARGWRFEPGDAVGLLFTAVLCAAPLVDGNVFAVLFGTLGGGAVLWRVVTDRCMRARTIYAVTDGRVLIVSSLFGRSVTVIIARTRLPVRSVERHRDGTGTIVFGRTPDGSAAPAFEFIRDLDRVLAILDGRRNAAYR